MSWSVFYVCQSDSKGETFKYTFEVWCKHIPYHVSPKRENNFIVINFWKKADFLAVTRRLIFSSIAVLTFSLHVVSLSLDGDGSAELAALLLPLFSYVS